MVVFSSVNALYFKSHSFFFYLQFPLQRVKKRKMIEVHKLMKLFERPCHFIQFLLLRTEYRTEI